MALESCGAGRSDRDLRAEELRYQRTGYDWPPSGNLYTCDVCGKSDVWSPGWSWYGSIADVEGKYRGYKVVKEPQPEKIVTTCSDDCREQVQAAPMKGKHRVPKDAPKP